MSAGTPSSITSGLDLVYSMILELDFVRVLKVF
jgi:hypothetical protein